MKVLVTGAHGQVGSELCRNTTDDDMLEIVGWGSSDLDVTNRQLVFDRLSSLKPDLVINASAYTAVDKAESEEAAAFQVNASGSANLAEATASLGIPIFHISTDYVFDGSSGKPYKESDAVSPLGVYGRSKLEGERLVAEFNDKHIIMRTSWVFGLNGGNFPKTMLRLAAAHPEIRVVDDQFGCPTFAGDIADALLFLARKLESDGGLPWGLYHYSGFESCSWHQFACATLQKACDEGLISDMPVIKAIPTKDYPTPAKRPQRSVFDCRKWVEAFPGLPLSDWKRGIDALISSLGTNTN